MQDGLGLAVALSILLAACAQIAGLDDGKLASAGGAPAQGGGGVPSDGSVGGSSGNTGGGGTSSGGTSSGGTSSGGFSGYAAEVMADGPVAYYQLDEAVTPTATDATGHGNDGTYKGGVTLGAPGALAGDADPAAAFDGTGSVDLGARFGFEGTVPFTLEFWVNPHAHAFAAFSKAAYDGVSYSGWFFGEGNNGVDFRFRRVGAVSTTGLALDVWTYVVGTFDGQTLSLYLDGKKIASQLDSAALGSVASPTLIATSAQWGNLTGSVDEVAVYDKVLPAIRITAHYQAATTP